MFTIDLNRVRLFVPRSRGGQRERAVRLIQRTTRRLRLTEAGRVYYESVSCALSGMDDAAAALWHRHLHPPCACGCAIVSLSASVMQP